MRNLRTRLQCRHLHHPSTRQKLQKQFLACSGLLECRYSTVNKKIQKNIFLIVISCYLLAIALSGCATVPKSGPASVSSALQDKIVNINGVNYIPMIIVCDRFDLKWSWDAGSRKLGIQNNNIYARFMEGSNFALVNDKVEKMDAPAILYQGAFLVSVSFIQNKILYSQLKTMGAGSEVKPRYCRNGPYLLGKVVIDAGHGGNDPGAIGGRGLREKDVTLDIAKRLKSELECEGFQVRLTRSDDRFIPLAKRAQIANDCQADFFVSIHVNAARMKNAKGFEVYYLAEAGDEAAKQLAQKENACLKFEDSSYNLKHSNNLEGILWDLVSTENRAESIQLASDICKEARKSLWVHQRGVKSAQFYVLKGARMPAILVEVGFITNRDEEEKLKTDNYRDSVSGAIAKGILDYREEYQIAEGFSKK